MSHLLHFRKEYFKRTDDSSTDMNLNFTGGGIGAKTFRVAGPSSGVYYGELLQLLIQDGTGWHSARFAGMGAALTNGVIIRHRDLGTPADYWSWTIKRNNALQEKLDMPYPPTDYTNGETVAIFQVPTPNGMAIQLTSNDVLEIVLSDDLSGLTRMRAQLLYGIKT